MMSKIELECLLIRFICFNFKFKVTFKRELLMPVPQNSFRKKSLKFCNITVSIFRFCDKTIKHASKCFILVQITQNLEFVNLKYVTYTEAI